jgi:hypothetical protein
LPLLLLVGLLFLLMLLLLWFLLRQGERLALKLGI